MGTWRVHYTVHPTCLCFGEKKQTAVKYTYDTQTTGNSRSPRLAGTTDKIRQEMPTFLTERIFR